ncbi:MAG: hypothetical protein ACI30M_04490 [Muribaculaceae bacterium]
MLKTRQGAQRRRLVIINPTTSWLGESRLMVYPFLPRLPIYR